MDYCSSALPYRQVSLGFAKHELSCSVLQVSICKNLVSEGRVVGLTGFSTSACLFARRVVGTNLTTNASYVSTSNYYGKVSHSLNVFSCTTSTIHNTTSHPNNKQKE